MAAKKLSFEDAMARLEVIVTQLEQGDSPLEESLALFTEGTALMKQCAAALDKAEQKVTKLMPSASGHPVETEMEAMEL